jgi:hypothetical protein
MLGANTEICVSMTTVTFPRALPDGVGTRSAGEARDSPTRSLGEIPPMLLA